MREKMNLSCPSTNFEDINGTLLFSCLHVISKQHKYSHRHHQLLANHSELLLTTVNSHQSTIISSKIFPSLPEERLRCNGAYLLATARLESRRGGADITALRHRVTLWWSNDVRIVWKKLSSLQNAYGWVESHAVYQGVSQVVSNVVQLSSSNNWLSIFGISREWAWSISWSIYIYTYL